jgi:uncharacterized protein (DUF1684 family)
MRIFTIITLLLLAALNGCEKDRGSEQYIKSIKEWHKQRVARLKTETGWLNLVGLYWLKEGKNTFGSAEDNDIIFPENAPGHIGTFILNDSTVYVKINPDVKVLSDSQSVTSIIMNSDLSDSTTVLRSGSFLWFIIDRNGKYGVRLRDLNAPLVKEFKGIDMYPIDEKWRVKARFEKYPSPKVIEIPNIIGSVEKDTVEGRLVFKLNGEMHSLDPVTEGNDFFIIFADETNGEETYGAGRFLYTDKPDSLGMVILDFNKAYNPPCAFTRFATCPLPPKDNFLHLKITAGEKKYGNH